MIIFASIVRELQATTPPIRPTYNKGVRSRQYVEEVNKGLSKALKQKNFGKFNSKFRKFLAEIKKNSKRQKSQSEQQMRQKINELQIELEPFLMSTNLQEADRRSLSVLKNFRKFLDGSAFNALPPSDSQIDSEKNYEHIEQKKKVGNWSWGTRTYDNGDSYEGFWENGKRHGWGIQTYDNGDEYRGNWENDKKTWGTQTYDNGDEYRGNWDNDKRHGWGTQTYDNGDSYRGNWENDKRVF